MKNLYKDLMELPGTSAHEGRIRNYMEEFIKDYPNYLIKKDNLGSIFAYKKSKNKDAKTLMIAGHLDEVGLMVKGIKNNGALEVLAIGGLLGEVFISQVLYVYTKDGLEIPGVIGSIPPHLKTNNKVDIENLLVDIGASSKEEVINLGIEIGDMVSFKTPYLNTFNDKMFIAKSIDNRFGCALSLETIKHFHDIELEFNIAIGATVQEEVGLRGAKTSVNLIKPDMFIALDASPVNDLYDPSFDTKLGKGFLVRVYDPRNIMPQNLKRYFIDLANKNNIPYQLFISKGGTDAAMAHNMYEGIISTTIGLPARYIHSSAAIASYDDLNSARMMLFTLINNLTNKKIDLLKGGNLIEDL
ncbi:MAG: hypothetical protein WC907_01385 [Acholeplasmataceae bacterium]